MGFYNVGGLFAYWGYEGVFGLGLNFIFAICYIHNIFGGGKTNETCNCSFARSLS